MEDDVVALVALHMRSLGFFPSKIDTSVWDASLSKDGLYSEHWLLSYEAKVQDWLPSKRRSNYVAADDFFAVLERNDVRFYDTQVTAVPVTAGVYSDAE